MSGQELAGGGGAVGEGGGEVEEVFEEDFYSREAGGCCCGELWGYLMHPGTLELLVEDEEGGGGTYAQGHAADCWSVRHDCGRIVYKRFDVKPRSK